MLGKDHVVKSFKECDFSRMRAHLDKEKLIKKAKVRASWGPSGGQSRRRGGGG